MFYIYVFDYSLKERNLVAKIQSSMDRANHSDLFPRDPLISFRVDPGDPWISFRIDPRDSWISFPRRSVLSAEILLSLPPQN